MTVCFEKRKPFQDEGNNPTGFDLRHIHTKYSSKSELGDVREMEELEVDRMEREGSP